MRVNANAEQLQVCRVALEVRLDKLGLESWDVITNLSLTPNIIIQKLLQYSLFK